jgi:hypothetical protein
LLIIERDGKALEGLTRARKRQWKRELMEKAGLAWTIKKPEIRLEKIFGNR